jgi:hypothetical protein
MSSIAAGTTSGSALVSTGDTTGALQLQVNGTTPSVTLAANGSIGVGSTPSYGTAGQALLSGGSGAAPTWGGAGALTFLATITPTAAATVQSLNIFTSTYDNYYIVLNNINVTSATDTVLAMRFAVAGAVDSTSNYFNYTNSGSTAGPGNIGEILGGVGTMTTSTGKVTMAIQLINVNSTLANSYRYCSYGGAFFNNDAGADRMFIGGLCFKGSSALTGFSFSFTNGSNFQATGNIRVYGYSNS